VNERKGKLGDFTSALDETMAAAREKPLAMKEWREAEELASVAASNPEASSSLTFAYGRRKSLSYKKSFSCETTFPFFIEPLMSRWRVRRRSPRGLLGTGRRRLGFRRRIEPRGARALPGPASVGEPAHCRSTHMLRPQHLPPGMSVDLQLGFCSWSRLLRTRASRPSRAQTSAPAFVSPSLRARACFGTVFSLPPSHPATLNRIYIHVYHPTTVLDLSRSVSLSASDLYLVPSALSKRGPVPPVSLFFSLLLRCYPFTPFCDVDVTFLLCGLTLRLCQSNRLYIPLVPLSASKWTRTGGMRPDN